VASILRTCANQARFLTYATVFEATFNKRTAEIEPEWKAFLEQLKTELAAAGKRQARDILDEASVRQPQTEKYGAQARHSGRHIGNYEQPKPRRQISNQT